MENLRQDEGHSRNSQDKRSKRKNRRSSSRTKKASSRRHTRKSHKKRSTSSSESGVDNRSRSRSRSHHRNRSRRHNGKKYRKRSPSSTSSSSSSLSRSSGKFSDAVLERPIRNDDSPLQRYRANQANSHQNEKTTSNLHWDGFNWVIKTSNPELMVQNKKLRRVQISNLPLYLDLTGQDIKDIINKFLVENYLTEENNLYPVVGAEINHQTNTVILELTSIEVTNVLVKVDTVEIFGHLCKITRVTENMFGPTSTMANLIISAQMSAQAQAAAIQAMNAIRANSSRDGLNLKKLILLSPLTRFVKVSNILDPEKISSMKDDEFEEILRHVVLEFNQYSKLLNAFMIKQKNRTIGAQCGSIFLEFETKEAAERAMEHMVGRKFDGREIRMVCVNEKAYFNNFAPLQQ